MAEDDRTPSGWDADQFRADLRLWAASQDRVSRSLLPEEQSTQPGPALIEQRLSTQTHERLAALAEDVTHKTRALENQKDLIERTLIEANRLNEMVRARDSHIAKLNEGRQQVARTEKMLRRIEKLAAKTTAQLERATKMKDERGGEVARFEQEAQRLTESIGNHVEQLVVKEIEFEAFYQRLLAAQTAFHERALAVESVHKPIEHSLGEHEAGATTTSDRWEARWVSHRRRMSHALTILVTQMPSWTVRHRAHVLGGLGVFALVSFILMRSVQEVDRISTNHVVPQAQPALNASLPETPGTMKRSVATSTETAVTAQPSREAEFEKTPVRAAEFIGTLAVQSDPVGAAVFINRRPVGTTPLQVRRLSAGSHAVWVEREGYERWTAAVRVPADRLTRINVRLRRKVVSDQDFRPRSSDSQPSLTEPR